MSAVLNNLGLPTSRRKSVRFDSSLRQAASAPDITAMISTMLQELSALSFGESLSSQPATNDPFISYYTRLTDGLAELRNESYDEDFIAPSAYAYECARDFMFAAFNSFGCKLPVPFYVPDGEGGIRIEWEQGARELRLICPASDSQSPYLYHEEGSDYEVDEQVTDSVLRERLRWLISA